VIEGQCPSRHLELKVGSITDNFRPYTEAQASGGPFGEHRIILQSDKEPYIVKMDREMCTWCFTSVSMYFVFEFYVGQRDLQRISARLLLESSRPRPLFIPPSSAEMEDHADKKQQLDRDFQYSRDIPTQGSMLTHRSKSNSSSCLTVSVLSVPRGCLQNAQQTPNRANPFDGRVLPSTQVYESNE
jgi:hypothetical protein